MTNDVHRDHRRALDAFVATLDRKVTERSSASNDYTLGYFLLERPGDETGGLSDEKLAALCRRLNVTPPSPEVVALLRANPPSYRDLRKYTHPFADRPKPPADPMHLRGPIPSRAELGVTDPPVTK